MFGPCVQLRNFCRAGQPFAHAQGFVNDTGEVPCRDILGCRKVCIVDLSILEFTDSIGVVATVLATLDLPAAIEGQLGSVPGADLRDADPRTSCHLFDTMLDVTFAPKRHLLCFAAPFLGLMFVRFSKTMTCAFCATAYSTI